MNFKKKKIGDIASITTGLVVRRKQVERPSQIIERYRMLTLKSFEQDGWLNKKELEDFESIEKLDDKYLTREGDVIVRLSHPNTAIAIDKDFEGLLISSLFVVIRLKTDIILPEYLSIYLNSDRMKRFYVKRKTGSVIQIIQKGILKDITVRFPDLETQEKLIELNRLILKEKKLLSKLIAEKNQYHRAILNKII